MPRTLERTLRRRDLILIVVGTVIGSGIFIVPGVVLRQTGGDVGPAMVVWLAAGVLSLLGALTYGELGAMRPEAGGLYVYIREAFGPLTGFLYGWTLFFVIASGSVAALAVAATAYLNQLVPLGDGAARLAPIAVIALVAAINVKGTGESASVQTWTTLLKAGAVVAMSSALVYFGAGTGESARALWPGSISPSLLSGIGIAMIGALWAYEGWQYVTFSAGETRDPQRTFPAGIVIGTLVLIMIYLFANVGYIAALGPTAAAASDTVAADAVSAMLGPVAGKLIAATIVLSMVSAANGLTLTAPRVFYAMARDGLFFRRLARVHPRFGTPALAVVAGSAWAMVLAASGTFEELLTYVVFSGWIFYGLGAASIFVYRRTRPRLHRPFRVPGYPFTPALFVVAAAALVINTIATQPARALVGIAIVLLGTPAYYFWRRRTGGDAPGRVPGETG